MSRDDATLTLDFSWTEHPNQPSPGGYVRPSTWRLANNGMYVVAVAPVTEPADPDWKSRPGSLEWQTSAELFNIHVGWRVRGWHWSVVKMGGLIGAGDTETLEEAQQAALAAIPERDRKKMRR